MGLAHRDSGSNPEGRTILRETPWWRKRAFGFDSRRPAGSAVVSLVRVQGFLYNAVVICVSTSLYGDSNAGSPESRRETAKSLRFERRT